MICRRVYQKLPQNSHMRWFFSRWVYSSVDMPFPEAPASGAVVGRRTFSSPLGRPTFEASNSPSSTSSFQFRKKFNYRKRAKRTKTGDLQKVGMELFYELDVCFCAKRYCSSTQALDDTSVSRIVDVPLAQTGEGIAECELLKWFVQEGDQVDEFQPLCEVQSDKATIEITSRYQGKVSQILHLPGNIVKVGETLLQIVVEETSDPTRSIDSLGSLKTLDSDIIGIDDPSSPSRESNSSRVLTTPPIRNLAKQYGIDINDVHGTGKDGRVLKEDVLKYAADRGIIKESPSSFSSTPVEQSQERDKIHPGGSFEFGWEFKDTKIPLRGYQRAMVKSMSLAAKIPHFHYVEEMSCDALVELKTSFQNENSDSEVKHTFLPVLIKSLSMALSNYPWLNSSFSEELNEVTLKGSHNIGIAMATPNGLVVPNIKKVQTRSILEITKELSRLHKLALANKLSPDDLAGGTITLSNIGAIGGKFGSPLVNTPEVCIIALGRIQTIPQYAEDGSLYPLSVMTINIGADHRVLDGAMVAKFCNEWKLYIEKPELLLLNMK